MSLLTEPLYILAAAGGAGANAFIWQIAPLVLLFVLMYFLFIRPQQQRVKQHRAMIEALRKGDEVVTQGGAIGKITKVGDAEVTVELAENVRVKVIKHTISEVRTRTEPANDTQSKDD